MQSCNDQTAWIQNIISEFVSRDPENRLGPDRSEPAFDAPLVGFSSGADPLYAERRIRIKDKNLLFEGHSITITHLFVKKNRTPTCCVGKIWL